MTRCKIFTRETGKKKINCLQPKSVNFHSLSPISLELEVLNQIMSSQCTMELCKKKKKDSTVWTDDWKKKSELVDSLCYFVLGGCHKLILPVFVCSRAKEMKYWRHRDDVKRKSRQTALNKVYWSCQHKMKFCEKVFWCCALLNEWKVLV